METLLQSIRETWGIKVIISRGGFRFWEHTVVPSLEGRWIGDLSDIPEAPPMVYRCVVHMEKVAYKGTCCLVGSCEHQVVIDPLEMDPQAAVLLGMSWVMGGRGKKS